MLDQQKSIWAHACPPTLHGVAIGFCCFLDLLAVSWRTLRTDDYFLEHEVRPEVDPVQLALSHHVRRIVQTRKHPHLLFIAPALVLSTPQSICDVGQVLPATDLQEIRLIEDVGVVVGARFARRDVEAEADALMRIAVMTPEQKVVPVPAEAQDGGRARSMALAT